MTTSITSVGVTFADDTTQTTAIPDNIIIMWYGNLSNIPAGWKLCNGLNGTPNTLDRFIVGAGNTYPVGATGGLESVSLTSPQLPSHTHTEGSTTVSPAGGHSHTLSFSTTGDHTHPYPTTYLTNGSGRPFLAGPGTLGGTSLAPAGEHSHPNFSTPADNSHTHTVSANVSSTGAGDAHENRPPFYGIALLMRI